MVQNVHRRINHGRHGPNPEEMGGTKIDKEDSECIKMEDFCQADCELCCRTNQELPRPLHRGDQGAIPTEEKVIGWIRRSHEELCGFYA